MLVPVVTGLLIATVALALWLSFGNVSVSDGAVFVIGLVLLLVGIPFLLIPWIGLPMMVVGFVMVGGFDAD